MRMHPTKYQWGRRKGLPWTDDDVKCAQFLRHCGMTNAQIAVALGRTLGAITGKIGYVPARGSKPEPSNLSPERGEIELLKAKIALREADHRNTAVLRHQLCELMARQIQRELATA